MRKFNLLAAASVLMPLASVGADGVEVTHLGVDNTLVRVTGKGNYLLLPIQDNGEEAKINVIVDNRTVKTITARLARNKTDYKVPLDLQEYGGKPVVLNVITPTSRSSMREVQGEAVWNGLELTDSYNWTDTEPKYRPAYHHTPLWGWMNDPNGMFYQDGNWHLYYQHNPYGSKWQNLSWGHSVSDDLIHWTHYGDPVVPDGLGMIFSGSSAIDRTNSTGFGENAVVSMYTSADRSQIQSLAHSTDGGMTFEKYPGNPTLPLGSEARDPNFFWNADKGEWVLVLAHALDHEMLIFTSPDMKTWTLASSFGKGLGCQDGVWECPDLFELPVPGTNKSKWVLICNINPGGPFGGSAAQYFIGDFDGKTFKADTDSKGNVPTKWMDYGKDHYATVSFSDAPAGRRVAIGWMSNWEYAAEVPTLQYRSANTLPREMKLFKGADGDLYLASAPTVELAKLRGGVVAESGRQTLKETPLDLAIPASTEGLVEIAANFDASKKSKVEFILSNAKGEKVTMVYDAAARTMSVDRTGAGTADFSDRFPAVTVAPTRENKGKVDLRIFVDRSSIEVFGNDGQFVMTNLVFPNEPYLNLSVSAPEGSAKLNNLKVYSIAR